MLVTLWSDPAITEDGARQEIGLGGQQQLICLKKTELRMIKGMGDIPFWWKHCQKDKTIHEIVSQDSNLYKPQ